MKFNKITDDLQSIEVNLDGEDNVLPLLCSCQDICSTSTINSFMKRKIPSPWASINP